MNKLLLFIIGGFLAVESTGAVDQASDSPDKIEEKIDPYVLKMLPATITYIDQNRDIVYGYVVINYSVHYADDASYKIAKVWQHRLHDAIIGSFRNYLHFIWKARGKINREDLKLVVKQVFSQVAGAEKIERVSINDIRIAPVNT